MMEGSVIERFYVFVEISYVILQYTYDIDLNGHQIN